MTNNEQIKERIVDAFDELLDKLDEVTGAEKERKKPDFIPVFVCPFIQECQELRNPIVNWRSENELEVVNVQCKAPFLINRKTGNRICRLEMQSDLVENWPEAIKDIGRARDK